MGSFRKAVKTGLKLRLAITGPAGSGKTYSALRIATAMGLPIAYLDTEHGSASKYADLFEFDVMEMKPPFNPERFVKGIQAAASEGYKVIVIDSLSHAWNGTGGILEMVEEAAARIRGNSYAAWKDVTPKQNALIEAIVGSDIHIIATMRSKMDYVQDKDDRGNTKITKVGMAPVQREGFEYEFDVVMDMDIKHQGIITKTRCPALTDKVFKLPGEQVADILTEWLSSGVAATDIDVAKATEPKAKVSPVPPESADVDMGMGNFHDAHLFDLQPEYFVTAWRKLTGKSYDFVKWVANLHDKSDGPCTKKQYGYLVSIIDALTNNEHNYALSVLCQSEISKANLPGAKVTDQLLRLLPATIKLDDGTSIPNPEYRQDMCEIITAIVQVPIAA